MRPAQNAFVGYSYQLLITFLILSKMDVEREIKALEIEADVDNNFDDLKILSKDQYIFCQIKDIDKISINDLSFDKEQIFIKGKKHKKSDNTNVLFFKDIKIDCNDHFFNIPALKISDTYIISISRDKIEELVTRLYKYNENRESVILKFFNACLDNREFTIRQGDLPNIEIFNTHLIEQTIDIGKKLLQFQDILFIEGKPGIGKSHLVNCLTKEYENSLIYRFWVSNQDRDYQARIKYQNFITNISREIFQDFSLRLEDEIIVKISELKKIVIIDGLDHVENYNSKDISKFIEFINKLKGKCKTIVLSRPLVTKIEWEKQYLENWNFNETKTVLNGLYEISDYSISRKIYELTDGYPILVRFVTQHSLKYKELPPLGKLKGIYDYYEGIISSTKLLQGLSLFLTTRSYIMKTEISLFLKDKYLSDIIKEFIMSYPYLFEFKLNRISLLHDSFNTFLRDKQLAYNSIDTNVKQTVYQSLCNGESRFLTRFSFFNLGKSMKIKIIKKYVNINYFKQLIRTSIDFDAIRTFYTQIRESISELNAKEFSVIEYYNLSLILNITSRDHISTLNRFLFTYVKSLLYHGYGDEDITSSGHLFCMYYYIKTNDATLLQNLTSNEHYDTEYFYQDLENDVFDEENYFKQHERPLRRTKQLNRFLDQKLNINAYEYVPHILANLYLHKTNISELKGLQKAIKIYLEDDENLGVEYLEKALKQFRNVSVFLSKTLLVKAKDIILSLGNDEIPNEYHILSLKDLIISTSPKGSFTVWPKVLNYIRLSLIEKRKIDLSNIGYFTAMYENRKDITVTNIYEAFKVFEDKEFISIKESIDIIRFTQNMSEKGIRHLLTSYISVHLPDIISLLLNKYHSDHYQITWFNLAPDYINVFPNSLFNYALENQLIRWNIHSKEVEIDEIENVLLSNRKVELLDTLKFLKYRIRIPKSNAFVQELQNLGCRLSIIEPEDKSQYQTSDEKLLADGILSSNSFDLIKKHKLKIEEVAGYTDENRFLFANLKIFKNYNNELVKKKAQLILRNAITGKINSINMFANIFYFPGNLPKFVNDYKIEVNYEDLYHSFISFMEISLLLDVKK